MDSKSSKSSQKHKVKVVVRVRPQLEKNDEIWVHAVDNTTLMTINHRNRDENLQYEFESVYGPTATQVSIFSDVVRPLLTKTFHGQNASVFAYGPTGAGKTHTILGSSTDPGIIPRCMKDVFDISAKCLEDEAKDGHPCTIKIKFSYLEIYQEKVFDLLNPGSGDLPIREDHQHKIFVTGLSEKVVSSVEEFNQLFGPASRNRTTAATKLNERSSRSHSILLLKITKTQTSAPFRTQIGKMYIIDLAGSEDNRRTGNKGIRLKESGAINSSLLALGQVVDALHKGQQCVPYRSSKLTRLLQDSLGGSAHACMMVNLAPEERHYFDTHSTLLFARKTKKVVNIVKTNETFARVTKVSEKKRPLEDKSSKDESPKKKQKTEAAPFLSPFLRDQERLRVNLKEEVFTRLEELEGRIMLQMKSDKPNTNLSSTNPEMKSSVDMSGLENIMKQLDKFKNIELASVKKRKESSESAGISTVKEEPSDDSKKSEARKRGRPKKSSKKALLKDLINSSPESVVQTTIKREPEDEHTDSISPLDESSSFFKGKSFRSTASKKFNPSPETPEISVKKEKENCVMNPEVQQTHNDQILLVLNTGSVKELQELQLIGAKRAKLIQNWRDMYGHFTKVLDLQNVTSFTEKFVANFMRSNFVNSI